MSQHYKDTSFGFEWGAASVERCFSDDAKGWVTLVIRTPKHPHGIQIYVTKTGKVRVSSQKGEWLPPKKPTTKQKGQTQQ